MVGVTVRAGRQNGTGSSGARGWFSTACPECDCPKWALLDGRRLRTIRAQEANRLKPVRSSAATPTKRTPSAQFEWRSFLADLTTRFKRTRQEMCALCSPGSVAGGVYRLCLKTLRASSEGALRSRRRFRLDVLFRLWLSKIDYCESERCDQMTQRPGDALPPQQLADNRPATPAAATMPLPERIVEETLRRFASAVQNSEQAADTLRTLLLSATPDADAILVALRPPRGEA